MKKLAIDGGKKVISKELTKVPWPPLYPETKEKLAEVYMRGHWSFYGPEEVRFNEEFAKFTGAANCIAMANGTVTLQCAMEALGIGPGDEVLVPAFTWLATGTAVVDAGAVPVVGDIELDTWCMDVAAAEAAITPRTRAIIPVHLFGSMANMDKIMALAHKYNLKVIEDCAHSHGGCWDGKHTGTIGNAGSFSFQESKALASGEGGACITNDDNLAETIGRLSHIGYPFGAKQGKKYTPPPMGLVCHNFRFTDFQAVILLGQLAHLEEDTLKREKAAEYLRAELETIPGVKFQARGAKATRQSYYMFGFYIDPSMLKPGSTRKEVSAALNAEGLPLGNGWGQPMYRQNLWSVPPNKYRIESCAVAEDLIYNRMFTTGLAWLNRPKKELDLFVEAVRKVMTAYLA